MAETVLHGKRRQPELKKPSGQYKEHWANFVKKEKPNESEIPGPDIGKYCSNLYFQQTDKYDRLRPEAGKGLPKLLSCHSSRKQINFSTDDTIRAAAYTIADGRQIAVSVTDGKAV